MVYVKFQHRSRIDSDASGGETSSAHRSRHAGARCRAALLPCCRALFSARPRACAELFYDRGNHYEFTTLVREVDAGGTITSRKEFPFQFAKVEKKFETYSGCGPPLPPPAPDFRPPCPRCLRRQTAP